MTVEQEELLNTFAIFVHRVNQSLIYGTTFLQMGVGVGGREEKREREREVILLCELLCTKLSGGQNHHIKILNQHPHS